MKLEDQRRVKAVFDEIVDQPPPVRAKLLAALTGGDDAVCREVEDLLREHDAVVEDALAAAFLEPPPAESLAERIRREAETAPPGDWSGTARERRTSALAGTVFDGRYRLGRLLGHGASASVFLAEDLLSEEPVAVKLLDGLDREQLGEVRREVAVLRLLRLPGVVQMVDEGVHDGIPYIVTKYVEGTPFGAGGPAAWPEVERTVLSLLETVARIHWAGIVHRDLKPGNVLVDGKGLPVVLDLGTATETVPTAELLREKRLAGTPLYIAPELFRGDPSTVRSDLYSVGVMLYEVLAGRPPHDAENLGDLLRARLAAAPRPLAQAEPSVPPHVAGVVDHLLAPDPRDRPASAATVIRVLLGQGEGPPRLPRLGGEAPLWLLLLAVERGESVDLHGGPGTGRTRCLEEFAAAARREGREVVLLRPGSTPYESLGPLGIMPSGGRVETADDLRRILTERVRERFSKGLVLLADDLPRIDEWTRDLLGAWRSLGVVVRATGSAEGPPDDPTLRPLEPHELAPLFLGADRLFHLPSDAARELHRRTGGVAAQVASEVEAWVRAGIARWEGERLHLLPASLDRLRAGLRVTPPCPGGPGGPDEGLAEPLDELLALVELCGSTVPVEALAAALGRARWRVWAEVEELDRRDAVRLTRDRYVEARVRSAALARWPDERRRRMHLELARALPPGADGRLRQLIAGGRREDVSTEALATARELYRRGRVGEARAAVTEGLIAVRDAADAGVEVRLLRFLVELALAEGRTAALDRSLYWLARARDYGDEVLALETIARAGLLALHGDGARALDLLDALGTRFGEDLLCLIDTVGLFAARFTPSEREVRFVERAAERAAAAGSTRYRALVESARGWVRYREGDFLGAAERHEVAARLVEGMPLRLTRLLAAASAWMEAGRFDRAAEIARDALAVASECRHPLSEARAEWILRSARYRSGDDLRPDEDFVAAAADLGAPHMEALIALNEAAVAWRTGRGELAARLAARAAEIWRSMGGFPGKALAEAFAVAATKEGAGREEIRRILDEVGKVSLPGLRVQALGFLARASPAVAPEVSSAARAAAAEIESSQWPMRREVISVEEALAMAETGAERGEGP